MEHQMVSIVELFRIGSGAHIFGEWFFGIFCRYRYDQPAHRVVHGFIVLCHFCRRTQKPTINSTFFRNEFAYFPPKKENPFWEEKKRLAFQIPPFNCSACNSERFTLNKNCPKCRSCETHLDEWWPETGPAGTTHSTIWTHRSSYACSALVQWN